MDNTDCESRHSTISIKMQQKSFEKSDPDDFWEKFDAVVEQVQVQSDDAKKSTQPLAAFHAVDTQ